MILRERSRKKRRCTSSPSSIFSRTFTQKRAKMGVSLYEVLTILKRVATKAMSQHPSLSLPLLPSGPGGVRNISLRGDPNGYPFKNSIRLLPCRSKRRCCAIFCQFKQRGLIATNAVLHSSHDEEQIFVYPKYKKHRKYKRLRTRLPIKSYLQE